MKILFTCNEYPPYPHGGQGVFVKDIAEKLTSMGHKIYVYGLYNDVEVRTILNINGIEVIKDPDFKKKDLFTSIQRIVMYGRNINSICKINKIEVVEAHDNGGLFLNIKHKPLFVRLHNTAVYIEPKKRGRFVKIIEKIAFLVKNVHVIGVSQFVLQRFNFYYKYIRSTSTSIVYNGIDTSCAVLDDSKTQNLEKSIVYAGTIKPLKGINYLIQAFHDSDIHEKGYKLNIYGNDTIINDKSYIDSLFNVNSEIRKLVDSGKINYLGAKPRSVIFSAFKSSELCVFPSILETFGLVVVEAMSQGTLVIYTDQGPAKEIIEDGVDGFLVKLENTKELANKINSILGLSDEQKNKIKQKAILKSNLFSIKDCASKTLELYNYEIK
jgi:glycosyltransferase involved in cell wall biosynthesis